MPKDFGLPIFPNKITRLLRPTWVNDAVACDHELHKAWASRGTDLPALGAAMDTVRRTEYWRELECASYRDYAVKRFGSEERADFAMGMAEVWSSAHIMPEILSLTVQRVLKPERWLRVAPLVTVGNIMGWVSVCMMLPRDEDLSSAIKDYKAQTAVWSTSQTVFFPVFMPRDWYAKEVKPHEEDSRSNFDTILKMLKEKA